MENEKKIESNINEKKKMKEKKKKNASKLMLNDDMHYALDAFFLSFVCLIERQWQLQLTVLKGNKNTNGTTTKIK